MVYVFCDIIFCEKKNTYEGKQCRWFSEMSHCITEITLIILIKYTSIAFLYIFCNCFKLANITFLYLETLLQQPQFQILSGTFCQNSKCWLPDNKLLAHTRATSLPLEVSALITNKKKKMGSQQTVYTNPMMDQCWSAVCVTRPAIDQHRVNVCWFINCHAWWRSYCISMVALQLCRIQSREKRGLYQN